MVSLSPLHRSLCFGFIPHLRRLVLCVLFTLSPHWCLVCLFQRSALNWIFAICACSTDPVHSSKIAPSRPLQLRIKMQRVKAGLAKVFAHTVLREALQIRYGSHLSMLSEKNVRLSKLKVWIYNSKKVNKIAHLSTGLWTIDLLARPNNFHMLCDT